MAGRVKLGRLMATLGLAAMLAGQVSQSLAQAPAPDTSSIGRALEHQNVPMRDGVMLDTSIWLPKGPGPFPTVLTRTPYTIDAPTGGFMKKLIDAGYAIVVQNERGMYLSGGRHNYMANAGNDGYDTLSWIAKQPWSTGKIGTYGCSSTAEDQLALIAENHPNHAAAIVLGFGAGIGHIGPYAEQGNIYRGGALQLLFASWFRDYIGSSGPGADQKLTFASNLSPEDKTRLSNLYDLKLKAYASTGKVSSADMMKFYDYLPAADIVKNAKGPITDWDQFARLTPADPIWKTISFGNEGDTFGVPTIWGVSWYDVSVAENLNLFDYARTHIAANRPKDEQYLIVSPGTHCTYQRQPAKGPVGERDIGDASYDFDKRFIDFFDWKLKGIANGSQSQPHVMTYQMGENRWIAGDRPMASSPHEVSFYLASSNGANSVYGDGALVPKPVAGREADSFFYDPRRPVPTLGGGACCMGEIPAAGAYDQAPIEARNDVLVYSTPPLTNAVAVRGPVKVDLYLSSDVPDTDLTVKLTDVYPDGRSYNLDDTIFRVRYRDGYGRPQLMQKGKVYKVSIPPMFTGNTFLPGHRIRVQITSSNFPRYDRNLNTGGPNSTESVGRVAHNSILHSAAYPSRISLATD